MGRAEFKVEQIDHVHVYVTDQFEAAKWYERVLGLEILDEHKDWADDGGPLTISSNNGGTSLALFKRRSNEADHHRTIAFRVNGEGFIKFLDRLEELELKDEKGRTVSAKDVVDHDRSFSVYFSDPYNNPYELTTYDYSFVREQLKK